MKGFIFLAVATLTYAKSIDQAEPISAYGYNRRVAIPLGEEIRKAEEAYFNQVAVTGNRIAGGSLAQSGQFPYQAGVLTSYADISGVGVCGGSLVRPDKVIHAAHCWFDGRDQGISSEIVLGSNFIFFGGTRIRTSNIVMHPGWDHNIIQNDVAVIYLPIAVQLSNTIAPIALPTGSQLNEDFANEIGVASGFGRTGDGFNNGITQQQSLSFVNLNIMTNSACRSFFPANVVDSNVCTSGSGGTSTCRGDSGGPLAVTRNNEPLLVGITSFGSILGCTRGFPAAFARVSSFMSFFNQHL